MVGGAAAVLGALEHQLQLLAYPRLSDELGQAAGAQARVDVAFADRQRRGHVAVFGFTHLVFPSRLSAVRSASAVLASGVSASTLSVVSSACLAAKPNPTSASITGARTA